MSMSRKDFVALANGLGLVARYRDLTVENAPQEFNEAVTAVMDACQQANPAFSRGTFLDHLWDIAEGRRDRQGRKVKVVA